ncbi:DUF4381 domain-containing protein [Xanthobacteraceae bacterium A53D]
MDDPGDLSRLADIAVPPPVPWWPPAPGWWVLACGLLAALVIVAWGLAIRHRRNAYRRAALAELAAIGPAGDPGSAAAVSAILKRAALAAYPRTQVAGLTGQAWLAFLDRTAGSRDFSDGPAATLAQAAMGAPIGDGPAILAAARRWIRHHKGEGTPC